MPWLVKTEPETYSIDDLARDGRTRWEGVRNYQARNTMRDLMKMGDPVLIYHSSADPPGIVGLARVSAPAKADATARDRKSPYFDPKATASNPIWVAVELAFVRRFDRMVPLEELRAMKELSSMALLQRGQRLSVQPVSDDALSLILRRADEGTSHPSKRERPASAAPKARRR